MAMFLTVFVIFIIFLIVLYFFIIRLINHLSYLSAKKELMMNVRANKQKAKLTLGMVETDIQKIKDRIEVASELNIKKSELNDLKRSLKQMKEIQREIENEVKDI